MLGIALRALISRRTQSAMLVLLAALVASAAVAAPFFVYASTERVTLRDIAAAPADERDVAVSHDVDVSSGGASGLADQVSAMPGIFSLSGFTGITSTRVIGSAGRSATQADGIGQISTRDRVCAQVTVVGRCPTGSAETMISAAMASQERLALDAIVRFTPQTALTSLSLRVVGIYQPRDPADPYWGQSTLAEQFAHNVAEGNRVFDAMFVTTDTIVASATSDAIVDRDLVLAPRVLSVRRGLDIDDEIHAAITGLRPDGYRVAAHFTPLANHIVFDTNDIFAAVALGAAELVVFGWFALFLAIRATAVARRFDVGILKLRGVTRRSLWTLMAEQSLLPLLAGAPIGLVAGFFVARGTAGPVRAPDNTRLAVLLAIGAVVVTILGGLIAALIAERSALATPVAELLRNTPARRRGRRADAADALVVVLAVAGAIAIRTTGGSSQSVLAMLAPGLIAFAFGLGMARLLVPLSRRAVRSARRAGRVRPLLTFTYLARRPGLDRIFALSVIAVALCGYALFAAGTAAAARSDRATLEIGAAQVLSVAAIPPRGLQHAVAAADPSGRYAMAAIQITDSAGDKVLAVDSTRLASVVPGRGATLAGLLRPAPLREVDVTGSSLTLDATTVPTGSGAYLVAAMMSMSGPVQSSFGPLIAGTRSYTTAVSGCSVTRPCSLTGFQLADMAHPPSALANSAKIGASTTITQFGQAAPARRILAASALSDPSAWRTTIGAKNVGPVLRTSARGLSISIPPDGYTGTVTLDSTAYLAAAPVPVPVVESGASPAPRLPGTIEVTPFGFGAVPGRVVGTTALLPRLEGTGVLIDLGYASALAGPDSTGAGSQVWLSARAPSSTIDALRRQGLVITQDQRIAARAGIYAEEPAVVGIRFQVVAGFVAVAVAAAALLLVSSVERRPRARDLIALRSQGISPRSARFVVILGYAVLAGGAAVAGIVAAMLDRLLSGAPTLFHDGWHLLTPPPLLLPSSLTIEAVTAVVAFGAAAAVAVYQLDSAVKAEA